LFDRGIRSLAIAITDEFGKWTILGLLTFLDPVRPGMKQIIFDTKRHGMIFKMITGDHLLIARDIAKVKLILIQFHPPLT